MRIHPIVLDYQVPRYARGLPMMATPEEGKKILDRLVALSKPFGTTMSLLDGVGVIRLTS
jgi:poly-gamma-glutamate synthesis protein (capsule biosynthesis protein)